jgi:hypothetical protein
MDDLVRQLRRDAAEFDSETYAEAADRIEQLEAALREITESARLVGDYHHVKIARAALGEKKDG